MTRTSLNDHLINIAIVSFAYIVSMLFVREIIVPFQKSYLPAITTFAALIFPLHGVRVLSAWAFGKWSIAYLFIANTIMHLVLTPDADFTQKSFYAWCLVSTVCWFSFELFRICGFNLYINESAINNSTWRHLILIAFVSSVFNSFGHNIIFAGDILPENSLNTMLAFLIGDTLGTVVCLFALMILFRSLRKVGI
ncbi:MAG: hypothetical protein EBT20_21615 [Alphaproteobacteria bacterium]|jgi:hypothetical protein|nr:hypothetical protein [Alphaproteobacteria bacterium]